MPYSHRPARARPDIGGAVHPRLTSSSVRSSLERLPYAPHVKRLRDLFRLPSGRRPPTGPLTTTEASDAEALRQKTLTEDNEQTESEPEEKGDRPDGQI